MPVSVLTNGEATAFGAKYLIVRTNGTSGQMVRAQANTTANSTNIIGVCSSNPAAGALGNVVTEGQCWIQCDGTPTVGPIYLSATTAGYGTSTAPALIAVQIGVAEKVSGSLALVVLSGNAFGAAYNVVPRVANLAALVALPTLGYLANQSHMVEVLSMGDYWKFVPGGALTLVDMEVVSATDGGGQWVRMFVPNPAWQAQMDFVAIDPASGNDENFGFGSTASAAALVKLKTAKELYRRWNGAVLKRPIARVYGDLPGGDKLNCPATIRTEYPLVGGLQAGGITWVGVPTVIATGTLSAVNIPSSGSYKYTVTASWSGSPRASTVATRAIMIRKTDRTKYSWVTKSAGSGVYEIGYPVGGDGEQAMTGLAVSPVDFSVGDAVEMCTVPRFGGVDGRAVQCVQQMELYDSLGSNPVTTFNCGQMISFAMAVSQSWVVSGVGGRCFWIGTLLQGGVTEIDAGGGNHFFLSMTGLQQTGSWACLLVTSASVRWQGGILDNFHIYASQRAHVDVSSFSAYNIPAAPSGPTGERGLFIVDEGGEMTFTSFKYGACGATVLEQFTPLGKFIGVNTSTWSITSSTPSQYILAYPGLFMALSDAPLFYPGRGGYIIDGFEGYI